MDETLRIGRNNPCPCGSGKKYKVCCQGTVPWPEILRRGPSAEVRHLSARGKNILFLTTIAEALQFDNLSRDSEWREIKKACTPEAVKKIHLAITEIWPDSADAERVLRQQSSSTSGLYIGGYEPERVLRGVTRHALYADRVLLFDPFTDPRHVRPQFSPLERPEEWRATTLRHLVLWASLHQWINEGLVLFVKPPGDFNPNLFWQCVFREEEKLAQSKDLQAALDQDVENDPLVEDGGLFREYLVLLTPDERIQGILHKESPHTTEADVAELREFVKQRREAHPYFVADVQGKQEERQIIQWSTGANYEMAKLTAAQTGSFLLTDLSFRWKEMQIDREDLGVDAGAWEPFAKAFNAVEFKFLDNVPLSAALAIRKKGCLEDMRSFLRRVWRASVSEKPFSESNARALSDELVHHMGEAADEWAKIDHDLAKWVGMGAAGLLAAAPMIAKGGAEWLGAGFAVQGLTNLVVAGMKRSSFTKRYPAGFFLKMRRDIAV